MRDYEVVYIFDSALSEETVGEKIERYNGMLTGAEGAEVKAVDRWGKRQLAYPIRKKPNGYYVVAQLHTDPTALPEFERALKLDEDVLRYLIVLHEGVPTGPMTLSTREPRETADDDEEE
jgi:small subunit ribosomal protein S6